MLINNKSLIKIINKLNLTDDEREKFNKISEDDNGNFLYNGKPITGGAMTEQAAQIQANKTAIGDANSGLIKEVNMISEISKYTFNTNNITMISTDKVKEDYVFGEFIDNSCPVTTSGDNVASALFMAGLPAIGDWALSAEYSYFTISARDGNRYIGFQIDGYLLETQDLDGIKKFISKNPTLFYKV